MYTLLGGKGRSLKQFRHLYQEFLWRNNGLYIDIAHSKLHENNGIRACVGVYTHSIHL
jgi:hypothetical protein